MKTRMTVAYIADDPTEFTRPMRWFGRQIESRTDECIQALRNRTNDAALLRLSGGNRWLARRAIEIYKRKLYYAEPEPDTPHWDIDKYDNQGFPLLYGYA